MAESKRPARPAVVGGLMLRFVARIAFLIWGIALCAWYLLAEGVVPETFWVLVFLWAAQGIVIWLVFRGNR